MNYGLMLTEGRGAAAPSAARHVEDLEEAQRLYRRVLALGRAARPPAAGPLAPRTTDDTPAVLDHMVQEATRALERIDTLLADGSTNTTEQPPPASPSCTVI